MSRAAKLLVVDDDASVVDYLLEMLGEDGHQAVGTTSPLDALERIARHEFDLVIADVEMPELRGLDLMAKIHAQRPGQLVLLVTAFGSIDLAVKAVRAGACDFVTKPFRWEALQVAIERALRERRMRREIVRLRAELREQRDGELVARSPAMRRVVEIANRVARSDSNTLVTGPSGVGKGAVARHIHAQSARAAGPFVQVNCAALPSTLAEAELFGVRRGAFTDAREDRPGLFVQAHGGTLMLDEIGEMALDVQAKLLQAIESRSVRPVGAGEEVAVDVRIIGATNRPLEDAVADKRFREDLYYRLAVVPVGLPPLRERHGDVPLLVHHFLARAGERLGRTVRGVTREGLELLEAQEWKGNVRELENLLERALVLNESEWLGPDELALEPSTAGRATPAVDADELSIKKLTRQLEDRLIRAALERTGGNRTHAARLLEISHRALLLKIKEYGIER